MRTVLAGLFASLMLVLAHPAVAKQPHGDELPPGLQKKQARGESLPPGWQKKLREGEKLDREVYEHGKVVARDDEGNTVTVEVEDRIIKVLEDTHTIVDILEDY